jgi:hypothetical protein
MPTPAGQAPAHEAAPAKVLASVSDVSLPGRQKAGSLAPPTPSRASGINPAATCVSLPVEAVKGRQNEDIANVAVSLGAAILVLSHETPALAQVGHPTAP